MAHLLSELDRFEEEMRALGAESASAKAAPPPAHLIAQVPLPPAPPLPAKGTPPVSPAPPPPRPPPSFPPGASPARPSISPLPAPPPSAYSPAPRPLPPHALPPPPSAFPPTPPYRPGGSWSQSPAATPPAAHVPPSPPLPPPASGSTPPFPRYQAPPRPSFPPIPPPAHGVPPFSSGAGGTAQFPPLPPSAPAPAPPPTRKVYAAAPVKVIKKEDAGKEGAAGEAEKGSGGNEGEQQAEKSAASAGKATPPIPPPPPPAPAPSASASQAAPTPSPPPPAPSAAAGASGGTGEGLQAWRNTEGERGSPQGQGSGEWADTGAWAGEWAEEGMGERQGGMEQGEQGLGQVEGGMERLGDSMEWGAAMRRAQRSLSSCVPSPPRSPAPLPSTFHPSLVCLSPAVPALPPHLLPTPPPRHPRPRPTPTQQEQQGMHFEAPQDAPHPPSPSPPSQANPNAARATGKPINSQAEQLFQRDAAMINPAALEGVKAALASNVPLGMAGQAAGQQNKKRPVPRTAAGQKWEDPTLTEWPENDHRIFCGDLGNEVNDDVLAKAFQKYASFNKAKVVRDKTTGKTKGYGFVSFGEVMDCAAALKEMNGKYVGNRPIKLRKSTWQERIDTEALKSRNRGSRPKEKRQKKNILHRVLMDKLVRLEYFCPLKKKKPGTELANPSRFRPPTGFRPSGLPFPRPSCAMAYTRPEVVEEEEASTIELLGDSVIPVVNKLQDIFSQLGSSSAIDLPQVAVVGSQSSGKSSVLESLVGKDFLPRGSDVVTRRPLVLQLVQVPKRADGKAEEWGEFLHLPGKRLTDFSAIRDEIQLETEREVGVNKGITEKQIRLKIFSPHVLTITLVDLPGITKVPVGDQPSDIEARVRSMILAYIKHETCIILAVTPANADLANSDALQVARMADPDGHRTIGVITKLDIMDRGTDACNLLLGNVIPLRLGYVGVINRSQEDINAKKSVKDALTYEEAFFRSRPVYHGLADRCGIPQLAKKLNSILVQHIRLLLPDLKARINAQMVAVHKELVGYGEAAERATMGVLLLNILTKYSQSFVTIVDGKNQGMSTAELAGGARIHYIFQNIFVKCIDEVDPCEDLSDEDIRTAIQNATGTKNALFVPDVPFEVLVRRQISRLLDPSLQCARFVYDELVKIAHRCESYQLARFPVLRRKVEETVGSFLREGLTPAETMIRHLIDMEMDYINTSHPSFIGGSRAVEIILQQLREGKGSEGGGQGAAGAGAAGGAMTAAAAAGGGSPSSTAAVASEGKGSEGGGQGAAGAGAAGGALTAAAAAGGGSPSTAAVASVAAAAKHRVMLMRKEGAGQGQGGQEQQQQQQQGGKQAITANGTVADKQGSSWGISSIFGGQERNRAGGAVPPATALTPFPLASPEPISAPGGAAANEPASTILLREPPSILRASEQRSAEEGVEIGVTRLLLKSYYDIVRKNIQDAVPKAIMHFLVNHVKRELHSVFIQQLYREALFEEMLQEREDIASKRQRCKDIYAVLQQAAWTLDELPLDPDAPSRPASSALDATGLPPSSGLLPPSPGYPSPAPSLPYRPALATSAAAGTAAGSSYAYGHGRGPSSREGGMGPIPYGTPGGQPSRPDGPRSIVHA
ncbi:unnamed protein product [Closterium sp. Yama58-4]|nr:unnamed protein product [Closterium sp. Yama58-4]